MTAPILSSEAVTRLRKAGYAFVGDHGHSAIKVCLWTKRSLLDNGHCYKQRFYGISSHRCLQFTPALPFCTHACSFCWRDTSITFPKWKGPVDPPDQVLEQAVLAQRKLLNGFPGNPKANKQKWREAQEPNQLAISLAGEPTLYPLLGELIAEAGDKGFTTFLVSNGTKPKALEALAEAGSLPTQLYVSLCSHNPRNYARVHAPLVKNGWSRLNQSLELMSSLKTRKVLRLTLVKGLNLESPAEYAELIGKASPDYVEAKAYMAVGYSRERLGLKFMPSHDEIKAFAEELVEASGYELVDEQPESRVMLLCRDKKAKRRRFIPGPGQGQNKSTPKNTANIPSRSASL